MQMPLWALALVLALASSSSSSSSGSGVEPLIPVVVNGPVGRPLLPRSADGVPAPLVVVVR
jgi:hypothetical protein